MTNNFDWDEFLETVTGEANTIKYYVGPQLKIYIRYDLQNNDILAPDNGCFFACSIEPIGVEEAIHLRSASGNRVLALFTMPPPTPNVIEPVTNALAIFPDDDVSKATLALKGCPFVDLTS